MKRMSQNNINSPTYTDDNFDGSFGLFDMNRLESLTRFYKGGIYVDAGCGDSIMPVLLAERHPRAVIHAIDYALNLISFLAERFPKVKYKVADIYDMPFADNSVHYVVAGEVIEHLEDPAKFVTEALRILKPTGFLAVSTPLEEKNGEVGGDAHLWSWTEESVRELLSTTNSSIIQCGEYKIIVAWKKK